MIRRVFKITTYYREVYFPVILIEAEDTPLIRLQAKFCKNTYHTLSSVITQLGVRAILWQDNLVVVQETEALLLIDVFHPLIDLLVAHIEILLSECNREFLLMVERIETETTLRHCPTHCPLRNRRNPPLTASTMDPQVQAQDPD